MKTTTAQRKVAFALIAGARGPFHHKTISAMARNGYAKFCDEQWVQTDKTVLVTLTLKQYDVAVKLIGLGRINQGSSQECPGLTVSVLRDLSRYGLAEHVSARSWAYANCWYPTERLKKAFAINDEGEVK